jgi:hypothetical protein
MRFLTKMNGFGIKLKVDGLLLPLMPFGLVVVLVVVLSSCAEDHKIPKSDSPSSLEMPQPETGSSYTGSYEYEVQGCNTGKHHFKSREEFCQLLGDEMKNRSCAKEIRQVAFQQYCVQRRSQNVSLMGALDRSAQLSSSVMNGIQATRFTESFRVVSLGFGLSTEAGWRSARSATAHAPIALLDLNLGTLEIRGQPSGCRWSHHFSPIRDRTPNGRFVISLEEPVRDAPPSECREFLRSLDEGFTATIRGARLLSRSKTPELADVMLVFY